MPAVRNPASHPISMVRPAVPTNAAAKAMMDKSCTQNTSVLPPAEIVAKCEPSLYLGEEATKVRDEIWTRIQAA